MTDFNIDLNCTVLTCSSTCVPRVKLFVAGILKALMLLLGSGEVSRWGGGELCIRCKGTKKG